MTRRSYSNVGPLDSEFTSPPLARKRCACALTPIRRHTAPIALKSLGKHSVALPPGEIGNVGPKWGDETPVISSDRCNMIQPEADSEVAHGSWSWVVG